MNATRSTTTKTIFFHIEWLAKAGLQLAVRDEKSLQSMEMSLPGYWNIPTKASVFADRYKSLSFDVTNFDEVKIVKLVD
jgi:hypothetical protein